MEGTTFRLHDPKNPKDIPKNDPQGRKENPLGRWVAEITINASKKRFYGVTRKEAKDKLKAYTLAVATGEYIATNDIKVKQWVAMWLETYKKASVTEVTYENYTRFMDHTLTHLGEYSLQNLDTPQIQGFINKLIAAGLSPRSISDVMTTTKQCFNKAVELKYIKVNPCIGTERPKVVKTTKTVLNTLDVDAFQDLDSDHRMFPAILMQIRMGLRKGEVLGLRRDDIDLEAKTVHIHQALSVTKASGVHIKNYPKNASSIRTIPLHDDVVKVLQGYQFIDNPDNLAFVTINGTLVNPRNYLRDVYRFFGRKVSNHELRHTFITNMCGLGVDMTTTAMIAGHIDTRMVANVYNHPDMDRLREALNKQK